jgi:hypothetical protein
MKGLVLGAAFGCVLSVANARDLGQWEATEPHIRQWYQALMQPDNPAVSCCGEADAYWADSFEVDGDKPDRSRHYLSEPRRLRLLLRRTGRRLIFAQVVPTYASAPIVLFGSGWATAHTFALKEKCVLL